MTSQRAKAETFLELHHAAQPLLLANAWDAGSARLLASLGFAALATTSAGHAGTLGRLDGNVSVDEALEHARALVDATDLPVSSDFENGFADDPGGVAANITRAIGTGLAGASVEDASKDPDAPIYDAGLSAERVVAATEAAHGGDVHFVLTARAENFLHGRADLDDTIARLQSFAAAGADVVYAPGVTDLEQIRTIVASVDKPVNVLAMPGVPPVAQLAAVGVKRVSVGSGFHSVSLGAVVTAGRELLDAGTYDFWATALPGMLAAHDAFSG
jgi:2-methylisocitrate lyase-like PEP mutase family enzyme